MKATRPLLCLLLILCLMPPTISSNTAQDSVTLKIDGKEMLLSEAPVIVDGRTLVPLRGSFEALNAIVDWNSETAQAIVKTDTVEVLLSPDNDTALVSGVLNSLDVPATLIKDRLFIPLRFVAESLGHDVAWDGSTRTVDITTVHGGAPSLTELPSIGNRQQLIKLLAYNDDLNRYYHRGFLTDDLMVEPMPVMEEAPEVSQDFATEEKSEAESSSTNDQVEGVAEGDLVITDGKYIITSDYNRIQIIDPNPDAPKTLWTLDVDSNRGTINNLFMSQGRLVVLGTNNVFYGIPEPLFEDSEQMTSMPSYKTTNTFLLVYDLESAEAPELIMDMDYEGRYLTSRMIGSSLYVVTNKNIDYWRIDEMTDYELMPKYANNLTGTTSVLKYEDLRYFPDYVSPAMMMTIGINLDTGTSHMEAYVGNAETVYADLTDLYLAMTHYSYSDVQSGLIYVPTYNKETVLYRFGLDEGNITYETKGSVPGTVLNQFSLDTHKGNLRIATTTGEMWDENNLSANNLFILDGDMTLKGELRNLAQGERIYSVRFSKDRIYMVTFRQVDPFFVIDAENPEKPAVLGELKIPGFSTYMHILDSNHVLGFGTETDDSDGFVTTGGMKLSLFDVTDPTNPVEEQKEVIGLTGTYSELQHNHKALMISLDKGLMAFPISVAGTTPYSLDFVGAYVYNIDTGSFDFRGSITHKDQGDYYYDEQVKRVLYIGDYLYSLSGDKMKVTAIEDMIMVSELDLE